MRLDERADVVPDANRTGETFRAFKAILTTGIEQYVVRPLPKIVHFTDAGRVPKRKIMLR